MIKNVNHVPIQMKKNDLIFLEVQRMVLVHPTMLVYAFWGEGVSGEDG